MKKMLMLASVASMIDQFNMSNIQILLNMGYEVHVACNFVKGNTCSDKKIQKLQLRLQQLNIQYYQIDFARSVTKIKDNFKAYQQVLNLMKKNKYDFIHCHSPIGGLCGRIAAHSTKTKIIYTAHGFHFFKGAPIKNWLLYYPIERWLARYTDTLITINKEDYYRAKKTFKAGKIEYIPGVGIDTKNFSETVVDKSEKRNELSLPDDAFVILSVGELNKNKNHETIIKALEKLDNPKIYYIICGQGPLNIYLNQLVKKLGLEKQVKLLGFCKDINEICKVSDCFAFPSRREGLGLAALEAMSSGIPIITSNVHGILDYSINGKTGYYYSPDDVDGFSRAIDKLFNNKDLCNNMGKYNINAVKKFDIKLINIEMNKIYKEY